MHSDAYLLRQRTLWTNKQWKCGIFLGIYAIDFIGKRECIIYAKDQAKNGNFYPCTWPYWINYNRFEF